MSEQYTSSLAEMVHVQRTLIGNLQNQIRDLELDLCLAQPRQLGQTTKPIQRVSAKKKPITINGVTYQSRAEAAAALGISPQAVSKRAKKE